MIYSVCGVFICGFVNNTWQFCDKRITELENAIIHLSSTNIEIIVYSHMTKAKRRGGAHCLIKVLNEICNKTKNN